MKKLKILFALILLLAAGLVALHFVLTKRLGSLLEKHALPIIEEKTRLEAGLGGASVNLLKGTARMNGFTLKQPEGYPEGDLLSVEGLDLKVGLMALLQGGMAQIQYADIAKARLNVLRTKDGRINVKELAQTLRDDPGGAAAEPPPGAASISDPGKGPESSGLPPLEVKRSVLNAVIDYQDHRLADPPFGLTMKTRIGLTNLKTGVDDDAHWADIAITGGMASNTNLFSTALRGRIAVINDPMKLSFDLTGDVSNVEVDRVRKFLNKANIDCKTLALRLNLSCRDGVFDPEHSSIDYVMEDVVLVNDWADKMPKEIKSIPKLTLPVALRGSLAEPQPDAFGPGLERAIVRNLKDNSGVLVSGLSGLLEEKLDIKLKPKDQEKVKGVLDALFGGGKK